MKEKAKNRQKEKAGMNPDKNEVHHKMLDAGLSPSFSFHVRPVQEPSNPHLQPYLADGRYWGIAATKNLRLTCYSHGHLLGRDTQRCILNAAFCAASATFAVVGQSFCDSEVCLGCKSGFSTSSKTHSGESLESLKTTHNLNCGV